SRITLTTLDMDAQLREIEEKREIEPRRREAARSDAGAAGRGSPRADQQGGPGSALDAGAGGRARGKGRLTLLACSRPSRADGAPGGVDPGVGAATPSSIDMARGGSG